MDNQLKEFQKKVLICFSLTILLVFGILFMIDSARKQRMSVYRNITQEHVSIEEKVDEVNTRMMRVESKVDIILRNKSDK